MPWSSPKEVALAEGVQVATVYNWVKRGLLVVRRSPGGGGMRIRVDADGMAVQREKADG